MGCCCTKEDEKDKKAGKGPIGETPNQKSNRASSTQTEKILEETAEETGSWKKREGTLELEPEPRSFEFANINRRDVDRTRDEANRIVPTGIKAPGSRLWKGTALRRNRLDATPRNSTAGHVTKSEMGQTPRVGGSAVGSSTLSGTLRGGEFTPSGAITSIGNALSKSRTVSISIGQQPSVDDTSEALKSSEDVEQFITKSSTNLIVEETGPDKTCSSMTCGLFSSLVEKLSTKGRAYKEVDKLVQQWTSSGMQAVGLTDRIEKSSFIPALLSETNEDIPIVVIIQCPGGEIAFGFEILAAIQYQKDHGFKIYGYVFQKCSSFATLVLANCNRRYMNKSGTLLIHPPRPARDDVITIYSIPEKSEKLKKRTSDMIQGYRKAYGEVGMRKILDTYQPEFKKAKMVVNTRLY